MRKLALLTTLASVALAWVVQANDNQDARAVIDKAIEAHGGAKALAKIEFGHSRAKGTLEAMGQTIPVTVEAWLNLPDKLKSVLEVEVNNLKVPITVVFNGTKGWVSTNGNVMEMDKETVAQQKETLYAEHVGNLIGLKDRRYKLSLVGESKVKGKEAVGVRIESEGHRDVNLYFNKKTGLLLKTETRTQDPFTKQEITQEKFYTGYKELDGLKVPSQLEVINDGKKFMDLEITEVDYPRSLDESLFARP